MLEGNINRIYTVWEGDIGIYTAWPKAGIYLPISPNPSVYILFIIPKLQVFVKFFFSKFEKISTFSKKINIIKKIYKISANKFQNLPLPVIFK